MFIPKRILVACAIPSKENRPIEHVYVAQDRAWATDRHILVSTPVQLAAGEEEQGGLIPRAAIEAADKAKGRLKSCVMWDAVSASWFIPGMSMHIAPIEGEFPGASQCEALMAQHGTRLLHIDIALLIRAAKILRDTKLSLYYGADEELLYI